MQRIVRAKEPAHRVGGRYGPLLLALLALYLAAPLLESGFWSGRIILGLYYAVVVLGVIGATEDARLHAAAAALALLSFAANFVGEAEGLEVALRVTDVAGIALLTFSTLAVLLHVLRDDRVTLNTVLGGVCVYFMMSGIWAFTFALMLVADGAAFMFPPAEERVTSADALYFSLVTQTTLGYGDIVPVSPMARALSSVEALIGQVFLVALVARLVALQLRGDGREGGAEAVLPRPGPGGENRPP
jgi:voltage-gated potassium channel Kch